MSVLKYPILQSGFVAFSETGLVRPKTSPPTFSEQILFRQKNQEYAPYFYSEDVTNAFNEWRGMPYIIKSFDFQEKILKLAFARFGLNIGDWMMNQSYKPSFTFTHRQFLELMLPWMQNADLVQVTDSSEALRWIGIIGPSSGHEVLFPLGELLQNRFAGDTSVMQTQVAVRNWVQHEGGYESLLTFLFAIFGERTNHMQTPPRSVS